VVDLRLGTTLAIVEHGSSPKLTAASRNGLLATVSDDDPVRIFHFAASQARRWGPYIALISSVASSTDGHWLARGLEHADGSMLGALPVVGPSPSGWNTESRIGPVRPARPERLRLASQASTLDQPLSRALAG